MYLSRDEIMKAKESKGGLSSSTWFLGGDVETVVTFQVKPGGELARMIRNKIRTTKSEGKRIVQEEGGNPIFLVLKMRDPFAPNSCRYGDNKFLSRPGQDCGAMGSISS